MPLSPAYQAPIRLLRVLRVTPPSPRTPNPHLLPQDAADYKNRLPLIKTIKTEGSDWVSKYARGGSARTDSARRMYIAVDAVIGHLASNGWVRVKREEIVSGVREIRKRWVLHTKRKKVENAKQEQWVLA